MWQRLDQDATSCLMLVQEYHRSRIFTNPIHRGRIMEAAYEGNKSGDVVIS